MRRERGEERGGGRIREGEEREGRMDKGGKGSSKG